MKTDNKNLVLKLQISWLTISLGRQTRLPSSHLFCVAAHWLHHWPPGNQNKRDPPDVGRADQDRQRHGGIVRAPDHYHRDASQYQSGSVPHQRQVSLRLHLQEESEGRSNPSGPFCGGSLVSLELI